jgi:hypothetical protein
MNGAKITKLLNSQENAQEIVDFLKVLALKHVPMDQNDELKQVFERQDIELFYKLLVSNIPDLEKQIITHLEQLSSRGVVAHV